MSRSTISTFQLFALFPTEDSARVYLEKRLWPNGPVCPDCKAGDRVSALGVWRYERHLILLGVLAFVVLCHGCRGYTRPSTRNGSAKMIKPYRKPAVLDRNPVFLEDSLVVGQLLGELGMFIEQSRQIRQIYFGFKCLDLRFRVLGTLGIVVRISLDKIASRLLKDRAYPLQFPCQRHVLSTTIAMFADLPPDLFILVFQAHQSQSTSEFLSSQINPLDSTEIDQRPIQQSPDIPQNVLMDSPYTLVVTFHKIQIGTDCFKQIHRGFKAILVKEFYDLWFGNPSRTACNSDQGNLAVQWQSFNASPDQVRMQFFPETKCDGQGTNSDKQQRGEFVSQEDPQQVTNTHGCSLPMKGLYQNEDDESN